MNLVSGILAWLTGLLNVRFLSWFILIFATGILYRNLLPAVALLCASVIYSSYTSQNNKLRSQKGSLHRFRNIKEIIYFCIFLLCVYVLVIQIRSAFGETTITSVVDACKIVSLLAILIVGYELRSHIKDQQKKIKPWNDRILIITALAVFALIVKGTIETLIQIGYISKRSADEIYTKANEWWVPEAIWILSIAPIFLFALLDLYIAARGASEIDYATGELSERKKKALENDIEKEKHMAARLFAYSDLPAVIPLVFVLYFLNLSHFKPATGDAELFLSGAMAIIILSHSLCGKAVSVFIFETSGISE